MQVTTAFVQHVHMLTEVCHHGMFKHEVKAV